MSDEQTTETTPEPELAPDAGPHGFVAGTWAGHDALVCRYCRQAYLTPERAETHNCPKREE